MTMVAGADVPDATYTLTDTKDGSDRPWAWTATYPDASTEQGRAATRGQAIVFAHQAIDAAGHYPRRQPA